MSEGGRLGVGGLDGQPGGGAGLPQVEIAPGYAIPRILVGGWQLSSGHAATAADRDEVIEWLFQLAEAGFTTYDCGDIYSGVEELLGEFGDRYRGRFGSQARALQVHTKFVPDLDVLPAISRNYVEKVIDRSLRRLRVERLDLVQFHWWNYRVPRYVETALWLADLARAGKIRLIGATNFDVPRLRELVEAGVRVASHQVQYSVLDRRPENGMVEFCRRQGIALLCYGTVAGGFLSDRYVVAEAPSGTPANRSLTKYRLMIGEFGGWGAFQELLGGLGGIARRHGVEIANVAVRWVLERPGVAAAIVGARNADHLRQNLATFGMALDESDRDLIERLTSDRTGPAGDVYDLERVVGGPHAAIMKYNLNQAGGR